MNIFNLNNYKSKINFEGQKNKFINFIFKLKHNILIKIKIN